MTCGKNAYRSRSEAERVRRSVYRQRTRRLRIYHCPDCHMWHLTSG